MKLNQQQEEHAIFREQANMLDRQLMQGATGDSAAKHLHRSKNTHMGQFLSGAAKKKLVVQRKAVSVQYTLRGVSTCLVLQYIDGMYT